MSEWSSVRGTWCWAFTHVRSWPWGQPFVDARSVFTKYGGIRCGPDCRSSVLRSDTDAVTTTEAPPIRVKRVGKGGGASCPCFFLVALPRENDSSHFSFFSSLPPCNAIFRILAIGYRVEIENYIFLDSVQKRYEADDNFKFTKYVVQETTLFLDILEKICLK